MKNNLNENIDIHCLKVFCEVVENKSFTKAAKALFLSQPTISSHISKLENLFDTKLLDRLGNEIHPTKAGLILFKYGKKILNIKDEMVQSIHSYLGNISGELILGASTIPGEYILPEFVVKFKNSHRNVKVIIEIGDSSRVMEMVTSGQTELGFVGARPNNMAIEYFDHDNLVLIACPDYKWSKRAQKTKRGKRPNGIMEIDVDDLKGEPFIMREAGSGTRKAMKEGLESRGINFKDLKIICELGSTEAVKQAVMKAIGVSIVSDRAVKNEATLNLLKTVKVKGLNIKRDFFMIYNNKRTMSPIAQSFRQFIAQPSVATKDVE